MASVSEEDVNTEAFLRSLNQIKLMRADRIPCQIEEGLYLGSVGAAENKASLKTLNITHVLTVVNLSWDLRLTDVVSKKIAESDSVDTNLTQYFDECFNFIDEAKSTGGNVLVHCFLGRSRSVTIVVAYLMKKHAMTFTQALDHVRSKRPNAKPNSGFLLQLQNFEKSLKDEETLDIKTIIGQ